MRIFRQRAFLRGRGQRVCRNSFATETCWRLLATHLGGNPLASCSAADLRTSRSSFGFGTFSSHIFCRRSFLWLMKICYRRPRLHNHCFLFYPFHLITNLYRFLYLYFLLGHHTLIHHLSHVFFAALSSNL